jgi:hypothetical protein
VAVHASPSTSTPLPLALSSTAAAAVAAATSCNSGSSNPFLTLSLSNRKLSFGGSSYFNSMNSNGGGCGGASSFQTPTCSTTTSLVQGLEGLCLPSLEDVDFTNQNGTDERGGGGGGGSVVARTLQQKRPPTTPQQRGAVSTTFDYLATALRLPDIAFTGSSGGSM